MSEFGVTEDNTANMKQAMKELESVINEYGIGEVQNLYEEKLKEWKDVPLYVGITGRSGVGKSSFINALLGLEAEDEGAATIGITETTMTVEHYPHPKNKQLILCDLPGVGTPAFQKDTYFTDDRIGFDKFDMFLILTCDRFYEDDLWLAKGIEKRKKSFLFIRTKIGQDLENEKRAKKSFYRQNPGAINEVLAKVRANCEENLQELSSYHDGAQFVFLIDSYDIDNPLFDMNSLTTKLIDNFTALKRRAFILCLSALTPSIIEAKEKVLRERIWKVCAISAVGGAFAFGIVPGLSFVSNANVSLVINEVTFYQEQLGLDEEKLRQAAATAGMSWEVFKDLTKLKSPDICCTQDGLAQYCSMGHVVGVKEVILSIIPVLGSIAGATDAYVATQSCLENILDIMINDAKCVNECITNASVTSV